MKVNLKKAFKHRYNNYELPDKAQVTAFYQPLPINHHQKRLFSGKVLAGVLSFILILSFIIGIPVIRSNNNAEGQFIIAPGILTLTAYAMENGIMREVRMEEGVELPREAVWSSAISSVPGLPIKLNYPTDGVIFDISVDAGSFLGWDDTPLQSDEVHDSSKSSFEFFGQKFTLYEPQKIYWQDLEWYSYDDIASFNGAFPVKPNKAYVDILIKKDEHIIGYAVIEIYMYSKDSLSYLAKILKSVSLCFPVCQAGYGKCPVCTFIIDISRDI